MEAVMQYFNYHASILGRITVNNEKICILNFTQLLYKGIGILLSVKLPSHSI
jgi:hypothetical protein